VRRATGKCACTALILSIYIHDIADVIAGRCKYHLYADDLQLCINFSCKPEDIAKCVSLVNDILADIVNWSAKQRGSNLIQINLKQ
jgi:hypothetical protein